MNSGKKIMQPACVILGFACRTAFWKFASPSSRVTALLLFKR